MEMTVKEAIETTAEILGGIEIPVRDLDRLGEPLAIAMGNLRAVIKALEAQERKAAAEPETEETETEAAEDV